MVYLPDSEEFTFFLNFYYAYLQQKRADQSLIARGCNDKHLKDFGKAPAIILEYDDQK